MPRPSLKLLPGRPCVSLARSRRALRDELHRQTRIATNNKCNIVNVISNDWMVWQERSETAVIFGRDCPHQMVAIYELGDDGLIHRWREYLDDTVTANIGLHMHHLVAHPDDQTVLRANPRQMVVALEELLRAYHAVTTVRLCRDPYTLGDVTFRPGDYVAMSTPLAGCDPECYEAPQEIRLDRKPAPMTLSFGIHRCLGQHLARRELQIALQGFLAIIPSFVWPDSRVPFFLGNVLHVDELQLVW